ncbi:MAG TPA: PEGA domain-containing protein, partial [Vicinamibacterales bacterium]|nr:PEGA domain-containing protein [Vicinamibacterales bacterium]
FEPELIAALEPEPIPAFEPEPIAALEPEPIAALEPEPIAAFEPEPIAALEPESTPWSVPAHVAAAAAAGEGRDEPVTPEAVVFDEAEPEPRRKPEPAPEPVFEPAAKDEPESWPVPPLDEVEAAIVERERARERQPEWARIAVGGTVPPPAPAGPPASMAAQSPSMDWPPRVPEFEAPAVSSASPFALLDRTPAPPRSAPPPPEPVGAPPDPPYVPTVVPASLAPIGAVTVPPPMPIRTPAASAVDIAPPRPGIRLKPLRTTRSPAAGGLGLSDMPPAADSVQEEDVSSGPAFTFKVPWKYAAAAAALLVAGLALTRVDWPTSPKAAPVVPGTVVIESTPKGSEVFIDGKASGVTPVSLEVAAGRHELTLTRNGASHSWSVEVAAGARRVERLDWRALRQTGGIEVLTTKPGARVLVDGKAAGETPLVLTDLAPGRHVVVVQGPNGNVRRTVRVIGGETTKLDLAIYSGWVVVAAPIELQIVENGRSIGVAGEGPVMLAAGPHKIDLVNEALGYRSTHELEITPGDEARLVVEPTGILNANAVPWAEVFLDGNRIGETPLANVVVPLGTHELVFRHPQHGERRVPLTITASAPAQAIVDFIKP